MLIRCNLRACFRNSVKACQADEWKGLAIAPPSRPADDGVVPGPHRGQSVRGPDRSVAARSRGRRLEPLRTLVAEEVVPAEEVVDLQAVGAGVPLADVALEQRFVG